MVQIEERDLQIHVDSLTQRYPDVDVLAFHFDGRPPMESIEFRGQTWRVRRAVSELAMRSIVVDEAEKPVVILTPLRNRELQDDIEVRLGGGGIFDLDVWQRLAFLFEATGVDTRLKQREHSDAVARTLTKVPENDIPPVSAGYLDEKTVWRTIQQVALRQQPAATELDDWLVWAASCDEGVTRLFGMYSEILPALREWLETNFGAAGGYFATLLEESVDTRGVGEAGVTAVATGLALDASYRAAQRGHQQQGAWVEAKLSRSEFDEAARRRFAEETSTAWERLAGGDVAGRIRGRLDDLLQDVGGDGYRAVAASSAVSDLGWEERVDDFVGSVESLMDDGPRAVESVRQSLRRLREHSAAAEREERIRAFGLLAALAFRLVSGDDAPQDLAELGDEYLRDGSFMDAAREKLTSIDPGTRASSVVARVVQRALEVSEERNRQFATMLSDELAQRSAPRPGVGVQDVLDDVVAPVAKEHPVLLVVLDGLNWAVARWLLFDDALQKWERWAPAAEGEQRFRPMYATVPSVTKYSRTSLLTGTLQTGDQNVERREFPRALRDAGATKRLNDAAIFHQNELDAAGRGQVGPEVREAMLDGDKQVVGVVVNAIDDQLSGAEQVDIDWSVDAVTPLRSLLELARNRVVLIAGDHGHVWETDSEYHSVGDISARWRAMAEERVDGEAVFSGPMASELTGEPEILAAWSERLRYGRGHRGYHGGASMQEVLTPMIGLVREGLDVDLPGFRALNPQKPAWWSLDDPLNDADVATPDSAGADASSDGGGQLSLMGQEQSGVDTTWIEKLLQTDVFERQLEHHGAGLEAEFVARVLAQVHANGDKLSIEQLADLVDFPVRRLERRMPIVADVVNREGYRALHHNRLEQLIELDRAMLQRQFGLQ